MSPATQRGLQKAGKLRITIWNMRCFPLTQLPNYLQISGKKNKNKKKFSLISYKGMEQGQKGKIRIENERKKKKQGFKTQNQSGTQTPSLSCICLI